MASTSRIIVKKLTIETGVWQRRIVRIARNMGMCTIFVENLSFDLALGLFNTPRQKKRNKKQKRGIEVCLAFSQ